MKKLLSLFVSITLFSAPALAQDDTAHGREFAGEPTRILVLGTPHLSGVEPRIDERELEPLLQRLEAFAPDIIAIEAVPGQQCDMLRQHAPSYPDSAEIYCPDAQPARDALDMDAAEAGTALRTALSALSKKEPGTDRRRQLAALLWANGDPSSAAMHWAMLPAGSRQSGGPISQELAELLDERLASGNENRRIAAELAARLGHARLFPIDDHSADIIMAAPSDETVAGIRAVRELTVPGEDALKAEADSLLHAPGKLLEYYRLINSAAFQHMLDAADFAAAARQSVEARAYVNWWHARNLRMAANVVEAVGSNPGARVLVLTGASHKAYLDRLLAPLRDVEMLLVEDILSPVE